MLSQIFYTMIRASIYAVVCLLTVTTFVSGQNLGLDPSREISQYSLRVWKKKDGLPQNSVHAILHASDGYIWLGTEEGLVRFNGIEFKAFTKDNSGLPHNFIYSIYESRDSTLWVGTYTGLASFKNGVVTTYPAKKGLPALGITRILETTDNRIWVGTNYGLCLVENGEVVPAAGYPIGKPVITMAKGKQGDVLVGTLTGLYLINQGQMSAYAANYTKNKHIRALWRDPDGSLWVGIGSEGIINLDDEQRLVDSYKTRLLREINWSILRDSQDALWVGTKGGIIRMYKGQIDQFTYKDGLSSDEVLSMYEDPEGNLWIGTAGGGLNCITNGKFVTYQTGESPAQGFIITVSQDDSNTMWAGNAAGQVLVFRQGQFIPHPIFEKIVNARVYSILNDSASGLWVGLGNALYRVQYGRKNRVTIHGKSELHVRALYRDKRGNIWIGTTNGLYHYLHGTFQEYGVNDGLLSPNIRVVHEDKLGNIWIGGRAGLFKLHDGLFQPIFTSADSMPMPFDTITEDDDGTLWAGSFGHGVVRIKDGTVFQYTKAHGLFDNTAYEILDDGHGNLWMSCNNGIYRVSKKSLNDVAEGRATVLQCTSYGEADGMKSSECNGTAQPSGWKSKDGKLWFSTIGGVAMVDPVNLPVNTVVPPVLIENIFVDREQLPFKSNAQISAGYNEIEFRFACLSFRSPSTVQYKYQLVGQDREWVDAGQRRFALYSNLSPGSYTFKVIASNDDALWNETGATVTIELQPFFYQTAWFYALVSLFLVIFGAVVQRMYLLFRQREMLANHLQAQVARAQLQALRSQLNPHFLFNTLNAISGLILHSPRMAVKMMARLSDFLRLTLDTELIQKIPLFSEIDSLQKYVEIEQLRLGNRLKVEYDVPSALLSTMVPSLLLQPLVENAIRHGIARKPDCGTIRVGVTAVENELRIEVIDDGYGFNGNSESHGRGGVGLANTKARLQELYGKNHSIDISSTPKKGTRITIQIPMEIQPVAEMEVA